MQTNNEKKKTLQLIFPKVLMNNKITNLHQLIHGDKVFVRESIQAQSISNFDKLLLGQLCQGHNGVERRIPACLVWGHKAPVDDCFNAFCKQSN